MSFVYPEFYSLPPFFTLQPVLATRKKQLRMWTEFIAAYQRYHKKSILRVTEDSKTALFCNDKIDRKLSVSDITTILEDMATQGLAKWQDAKHTICLVTWKKFDEWGNVIYDWAKASGVAGGGISTVYELRSGDESMGAEFHGLEADIIMIALQSLESAGKVSLIPGASLDETGVKFHER